MSDSTQYCFGFTRLPHFHVGEGRRTLNWHLTDTVRDAFEPPEWVCLVYMQSIASPAGIDPQEDLVAGIATVSLGQLCAELSLAKSSLRRTINRLIQMDILRIRALGRSSKEPSTWRVANFYAVEEAFRISGCTHYCMQGSARRLFREAGPVSVCRS